MKRITAVGLVVVSLLVLQQALPAAPALQPALMPMPMSVSFVADRVPIGPSTVVALSGVHDARLRAAVDRAMRRLEARTGYTLARTFAADPSAATLIVDAKAPGGTLPALGDDESYTLDAAGSQVVIHAPTAYGAMHGVETFLQLLSGDREGFFIPGVHIEDRPRFPWRGLLIDVGRHFEPVSVIERELDAMAAVKLNVLHWHLSEDQGFRVESRKYPKLQELGSDGLYYTQAELREVVEYARMRGIRVVPEFDMPGHVTSWLVGYPQLASAPGPYTIARGFGIFDPAFDPTKSGTYRFIDAFIGEMVKIFPDPYWHVGGDENNGKQWMANPKIRAFMTQHGYDTPAELQAYFETRLEAIVQKHHRRMMGWDEILQPGLPKDAVVQFWHGPDALAAAAKQGYDGILSAGYYIDLMNSAASHYRVDPLPASEHLTPAEAAHVLGGEATMWGEWVGPETIDSRIWPRTAAIAERLWSPRTVTDVDDMYRRLSVVSRRLEDVGLTHLRNPDVLLRRLADTDDLETLKILTSVIEPVKGYRRGRQQPAMTTLGPLTHLVDAVTADSAGAREVSRLIGGLLDDAPRFAEGRDALAARFRAWRDAQPALDALIDRAPALREAAPLAAHLSAMGQVGLEALTYLESRGVPLPAWQASARATLDAAAQPATALEFPFVPAMRELTTAAAEQGALSSMSVPDWKKHVQELAAPPPPNRAGG